MSADADATYLRPIVERLGADEVHRLVDLIVSEQTGGPEEDADDE